MFSLVIILFFIQLIESFYYFSYRNLLSDIFKYKFRLKNQQKILIDQSNGFYLQVSWIRHRDIHILTVGTYTYTTDQRFQTAFHREINEWTMQIKWAQKRDAGMYECQISTIPIKSFSVRLNVVGMYDINKFYCYK